MNQSRAIGRRHGCTALCGSVLALSLLTAFPVGAAELVMFRMPGCPWCKAWDREVGDAYASSPEAKVAPLREVRLNADSDGGLALDRPVRVTPTFVLARDGVEVGRIEGYPGEAFFWGRLDQLLEKIGGGDSAADSPASTRPGSIRPASTEKGERNAITQAAH